MKMGQIKIKEVDKKAFINFGWLLVYNLFKLFFGTIIGAITVRYLGTINNGKVAYITAIIALFASISDWGLETLVVREISLKKYKEEDIIKTSLGLKTISSILCALVCVIWVVIDKRDAVYIRYMVIMACSYLFQAFGVYKYYFQAHLLSQHFVKIQNIVTFTVGIVKIIFVLGKGTLDVYFLIMCLENILLSVLLYIPFRQVKLPKGVISYTLLKKMLIQGLPIMIGSLSTAIYMKIDQVMVSNMLGDAQAGIYAAAANIAEVWYFIPNAIYATELPKLIKKINDDENQEDVFRVMHKYMYILFVVALTCAITITSCSKMIIKILYGEEFMGAASVLSLYVWAGILVCMGLGRAPYIVAKEYNKFSMFVTIGAGVINIVLNKILLELIGINRAAISTIVSYTFSAFLSSFIWKPIRKIGVLQIKAMLPYLKK